MRYALMVQPAEVPAYEYTSWPWLWVPQALYGPGLGPGVESLSGGCTARLWPTRPPRT